MMCAIGRRGRVAIAATVMLAAGVGPRSLRSTEKCRQ